jgi:protein-S-isoprenylcysteine O-methyltransferase Ste14
MNPSPPNSALFAVAVLVWTASEVYGGAIMPLLYQRASVKVRREKGSLLLYYLGIAVFLAVVALLPSDAAGALPAYLFYVGVSLMLAGIVLRQWAIASLGKSFSFSVAVRSDQKIVDTGPYRSIRHPAYTGIAMTLLGFGFTLQSWEVILVSCVVFLPILAYRIRVEELLLRDCFGEQYSGYMRRTKRLIPFLL